jgi:hypothetical protein
MLLLGGAMTAAPALRAAEGDAGSRLPRCRRAGPGEQVSGRVSSGTKRNRIRRRPECEDRISLGGGEARAVPGSRDRTGHAERRCDRVRGRHTRRVGRQAGDDFCPHCLNWRRRSSAEGLVASLAHPGGNITGLSSFTPELIGKRLELLKQAMPEVSLIAFLLKPDAVPERTKEVWLKEAEVAAWALGVGLQVFEARGPEDFDRAFADMSNAHAGALGVLTTLH